MMDGTGRCLPLLPKCPVGWRHPSACVRIENIVQSLRIAMYLYLPSGKLTWLSGKSNVYKGLPMKRVVLSFSVSFPEGKWLYHTNHPKCVAKLPVFRVQHWAGQPRPCWSEPMRRWGTKKSLVWLKTPCNQVQVLWLYVGYDNQGFKGS